MGNRVDPRDGLFKQNMVFMSGMLTAPVIACSTTLIKSLAVCFVFTLVSFASILVCRAVPRTIVYTVRVIIYSAAAAVFYIPVSLMAQGLFGEAVIKAAGVYLPILVTNSLILSKTETRFYLEPAGSMVKDVLGFTVGFDISCALTGMLREYFTSGKMLGAELPILFTVPALETTFGGFISVGIGAGIFRALYNYRKKRAMSKKAEDEEESLAEYAEDVGEFLVGKHGRAAEREKIRIYKAAVRNIKAHEGLLDMEFLSNKDILAEFEAIVSEGQEMLSGEDTGAPDDAEVKEADGTAKESENGDI